MGVMSDKTYAYSGGLLDGKTLTLSTGGTTTKLTDNNESTFERFVSYNYAEYLFTAPVSIKYVYLYGDGNSSLQIGFYDSTDKYLGNYNSNINNKDLQEVNFTDVKKVRIGALNVPSTDIKIYEADVLGSLPPPSAPTGLTGTAGDAEANLTWNSVAKATGYNVYKNGVKITSSPISTTAYKVTGLTNDTTYTFEVTAVNADGESLKSNTVNIKPVVSIPNAPTGLKATAGNKEVSLTWNSTASATGYNVYESNVKLNSTLITGTSYMVTGLTNGTSYSFAVTAVNSTGESSKSATVTAKPVNELAVNLVPNGTRLVVQVTGGNPPYTVDWGEGTDTFSSSQYIITGLSKSTDYTVTVTDSDAVTYSRLVNTGAFEGFIAPSMPNPVRLFQQMVDSFGIAGTVGIAVMSAAVGLGILIILGLWGWRLSKKWLRASK